MSRNETSAAPRANPVQASPPAPEPPPKPEIDSTPKASKRENVRAAARRGAVARPINLERRARFVRFGFGGA